MATGAVMTDSFVCVFSCGETESCYGRHWMPDFHHQRPTEAWVSITYEMAYSTVLECCDTEYCLCEFSVLLDYLLVNVLLALMSLLPALIAHIYKG